MVAISRRCCRTCILRSTGHSPRGIRTRPTARPGAHAELIKSFFMRAGADWEQFAVSLQKLYEAGDHVVAEVRYTGRFKSTGARIAAEGCHIWQLREGKVLRFQQYVDTAQLRVAMGAGTGL